MMVDIVAFPFHDIVKVQTEGWFRRDNQFLRELALRHDVRQVLIVDRPASIASALRSTILGRRWRATGGELVAAGRGWWLTRLDPKTFVLDTLIPDIIHAVVLGRAWWPRSLAHRGFQQALRSACAHLKMSQPIAWAFTPIAAEIAAKTGSLGFVFDAIDDWLEHPGMRPYRAAASKGYLIASERADIITCVASELTTRFATARGRVLWTPNAVGDVFFGSPPIPEDLSKLPRPRVGYAGVLEDRIDIELLRAVVESLREVQFCFVGPDRSRVEAQLRAANCHFLGQRPHSAMPGYIAGFDVAIVPHRVNSFTNRMSPLKLYEYVASARPVVTTPVAGSSSFADCVAVAKTPSEFSAAVRSALRAGPPPARCREALQQHSWRARVQDVMSALIDTVPGMTNGRPQTCDRGVWA